MAHPFKYRQIALGGTFDHLHRGHKVLLGRAFDTGESVFIGLTSDSFAMSAGKKIDQNYNERKKNLQSFLKETYPNRKYEISKLEDRFGPGIFTERIDAIAVSTEMLSVVEMANKKRQELGLTEMKVEVIPMALAEDADRISSTRIRAREIDEEGHILRNKEK